MLRNQAKKKNENAYYTAPTTFRLPLIELSSEIP